MIVQHILNSIQTTFAYLPSAVPALIVGIMIALCASLLGVPLVLKRFSFIGDGLSHVAFGAYSIALVLSIKNDMILILPVTVLVAILLLKGGRRTNIRGDASLAMMSVSAMGLGYLILNAFKTGSAVDVCNTLFGSNSILTLNNIEIVLSIVMAIVVILLFFLFYRQIFTVTFDESFATATGVNANLYNLLIAVITAIVIVIAMNLVGSLLISALIIFPALSSMRLFKNFRSVIISAAIIAVFASAIGLLASFVSLPATGGSIQTGPAIVAVNILIFLIFSAIAFFKKGGKVRKLIGWIVCGVLVLALVGGIATDLILAAPKADDGSLEYEIDQMLVVTDGVSPTHLYVKSQEMVSKPDEYDGQTIRAEGNLLHNGVDHEGYCIKITDETGCCITEIPLVAKDPDLEYPEDKAYIILTGTMRVNDAGQLYIETIGIENMDYLFELEE